MAAIVTGRVRVEVDDIIQVDDIRPIFEYKYTYLGGREVVIAGP